MADPGEDRCRVEEQRHPTRLALDDTGRAPLPIKGRNGKMAAEE
jgi:hypothetical protein